MTETLSQALAGFATGELGFDLFGVTDAAPPEGGAHLERWLADGWHGEMAWMSETAAQRRDPGRFLRGARSAICVALSYRDATEASATDVSRDRVVVARYARRKDYHDVIKPRLVRLGRRLAELAPGARWRAACDAQPLLERELAARAGLGWIGKNTCLINRRLGSEILLGELVTDVPLPPDRPATAHCGSCTACLDLCPTRALPAPQRLDARRCISYLTIEHRTDLAADLVPDMGAHLFGCDICQAVCPWNRRPAGLAAAPMELRPELVRLRLPVLERLDAAGWRALSAGTPLRRLDYPRFRRNLGAIRSARAAKGDEA